MIGVIRIHQVFCKRSDSRTVRPLLTYKRVTRAQEKRDFAFLVSKPGRMRDVQDVPSANQERVNTIPSRVVYVSGRGHDLGFKKKKIRMFPQGLRIREGQSLI